MSTHRDRQQNPRTPHCLISMGKIKLINLLCFPLTELPAALLELLPLAGCCCSVGPGGCRPLPGLHAALWPFRWLPVPLLCAHWLLSFGLLQTLIWWATNLEGTCRWGWGFPFPLVCTGASPISVARSPTYRGVTGHPAEVHVLLNWISSWGPCAPHLQMRPLANLTHTVLLLREEHL